MKVFVGTSGFVYDWNEDGTLDWYVENSGLNALELNMSFYRFPFPNQVKAWAKKGKDLRWIVKVNRFVTHVFRLNERAFQTWKKFYTLFEPLDNITDFYLFQLPPSTTPNSAERIEKFFHRTKLGVRFGLEWRNEKWFTSEWIKWAKENGITLVSVDAPELPRDVFCTNSVVYVRMHGRTGWYSHDYSEEELKEVAQKIFQASPERAYVMFNNNHAMLSNGRRMKEILEKLTKSKKTLTHTASI
jgi:uncharacterized protein YecE (DUF72 family)